MSTADDLRQQILALVRDYHDAAFPDRPFRPGEDPVPVAGRVFDAAEIVAAVDASLEFWLTAGRFADRLETGLAGFVGVRHAVLCNSGSSANLLAVAALTSPELGARRLQPGDEVITPAAGFPTTANPILPCGLTPVFVDSELATCNADPDRIAAAIGPRTRALILPHTLGNPFALDRIRALVDAHDLWLIEDNCDALGSRWDGQPTGSFGHLSTCSFYPAHHITTGEGGAVLTDDDRLRRLVLSFRDWGRDCWCAPGADDSCGRRFDQQHGELPHGYDHKYVYSHIGYNLKLTDLQAAVGVAQIDKLPAFIEARRRNFTALREGLADLEAFFHLPAVDPRAAPSWFGLPLTVREDAPFRRDDLLRHLNARRIGTRLLFGGNLARQPAYLGRACRRADDLAVADRIMRDTFWIGVYPGLDPARIAFVLESLHSFCSHPRRHLDRPPMPLSFSDPAPGPIPFR